MNRNPKEKTARIDMRITPVQKRRIKATADKCGLTESEYVLQRALGYAPKAVQPDAFFQFYRALCDLLNQPPTPETEAAALKLFDEIHAELMAGKRQSAAEIRKEMIEWQPPASGPSKTD